MLDSMLEFFASKSRSKSRALTKFFRCPTFCSTFFPGNVGHEVGFVEFQHFVQLFSPEMLDMKLDFADSNILSKFFSPKCWIWSWILPNGELSIQKTIINRATPEVRHIFRGHLYSQLFVYRPPVKLFTRSKVCGRRAPYFRDYSK